MPRDWYESFFSGISLDLWREAMTPAITRAEMEFLTPALGCEPGARLLDVPCGNGRHALEFASRGFQVTAIDSCAEFIEEGRGKAAEAGVDIDWRLGDMRKLPRDGSFDAVYCMGNSFGYLDHEGTVEFIDAVANSLRSGGVFVLDTSMAAESVLPDLEERGWDRVGDILMLTEKRYDPVDSRLEMTYTLVRDGNVESREVSCGVYTVAELQRMLAAAGLSTGLLHADTDGLLYEIGSPRLLLTAARL
jgi:SAM-dependent methyltransferase